MFLACTAIFNQFYLQFLFLILKLCINKISLTFHIMALSFIRLRSLYKATNRLCEINLNLDCNLFKADLLQGVKSPRFQAINRSMSEFQGVLNISINELKEFQKDPSSTIIDVREVKEIQETGKLPGSIHIPLGDLQAALKEENEKFLQKFNRAKPLVENPIIFSCRSGRRSFMASETALSLGFKKVFNYSGGWLDWEKNSGEGENVA